MRGASHPEELVTRAIELGYQAIAITDECSLSGVVRAHMAAKGQAIKLIIGSEFILEDNTHFVLLARDRKGYGQISKLITQARRVAEKGSYLLKRADLTELNPEHCVALWIPPADLHTIDSEALVWLNQVFPKYLWIAAELFLTHNDKQRLKQLKELSSQTHIALCAAGGVHMHCKERKPLHDILTGIRLGKAVSELAFDTFPNSEHYLRPKAKLAKIYPRKLLQETTKISQLCDFSLSELRYEYPSEIVPPTHSAQSWLTHLVAEGTQRRWPQGVSKKVSDLIQHELRLVEELSYAPYFLTVYDIVQFARSQNILCQGRGSAANSVICFCLGITEVDPERMNLLFERFISKERDEPPDIDVDFEHERREEVIQYIYKKYGRDRTALAATVITYRTKSALRDVGKALGMSLDQVDRLAKSVNWWQQGQFDEDELRGLGFNPHSPVLKMLLAAVSEILGFPRHLSQHVGGFIISEGLLSELVPIENAAMPERTVIQWEKDDLEAIGLLKVDVLALGMLTAIRKALSYINDYAPKPIAFKDIPAEDPGVYEMIQRADTVGVFQIESRAQMSMLPRLKPANYYDLVIEIAIVRPGPIQGDMVHPYLNHRRNGTEENYPSEAVKKVLQRTLGIPIFQEQVMQLAIVAASFTPGEADQLRRAMAAWKRKGGLEKFEDKLLRGMQENGYDQAFAQRIFSQIKGFGDYGFPESHSASFALLAYASSWLKCYHPAAFTCALLNSQPMGFYGASQLVIDAKAHGVTVLPIDVNKSFYDCVLEIDRRKKKIALRLGFRLVKNLSENSAKAISETRKQTPFSSVQELMDRVGLNKADLESLAAADALESLSGNRHRAHWQAQGAEPVSSTLLKTEEDKTNVMLRTPSEIEDIENDYDNVGLTLRRHPVALLRDYLYGRHAFQTRQLHDIPNGGLAKVAGLVIGRQRPGTASGVIFVTLEDESGQANVVVWPKIAEEQSKVLLQSQLLMVSGVVQKDEGVLHLIARKLEDLSFCLGELKIKSRDFH